MTDIIGGREIEMNYYAKNEYELVPVPFDKIMEVNEQGYDIFWTPQQFPYGKRQKEDLECVRFVYADFDSITAEAMKEILKGLAPPTLIVKTRSGFHVYWMLEEYIPNFPGLPDHYRKFVDERLVPLGADKNAKDVCRLMRAPMSRYWRDSKGNNYKDFQIYNQIEYETENRYTFEDMEEIFFRSKPKEEVYKPAHRTFNKDDSFWRKANSLDPRYALEALSGSAYVHSERFSFKKEGRLIRIIVNDDKCNAWIDEKNTIGSTREAGPTVVNWLMFYGHTKRRVAEILKELFQELRD